MTAEKLLTPNPPKLEMVTVPPMNSSGLSFFSLALLTRSFVSKLIWLKDFISAALMMGVMSPSPMSTAKLPINAFPKLYLTSTFSKNLILLSTKLVLQSGTSLLALATALTMKSFTDNLTPAFSWSSFFISSKASIRISASK